MCRLASVPDVKCKAATSGRAGARAAQRRTVSKQKNRNIYARRGRPDRRPDGRDSAASDRGRVTDRFAAARSRADATTGRGFTET